MSKEIKIVMKNEFKRRLKRLYYAIVRCISKDSIDVDLFSSLSSLYCYLWSNIKDSDYEKRISKKV